MDLRQLIQPDDGWLDAPTVSRVLWVAAAAAAGLAVYGFTVGFWRDPVMGGYVAVKMPLLIALTLTGNGLLNGLLGMLLGTGLGFRQSWLALLTSFAVAGVILGSLAPVTFFIAWNAPTPESPAAPAAHAGYLVCHTVLIGFAGIASNIHLHRMLAARSPSPAAATATLLAWLGGNGFLGAQFSWVLRPFFGTPSLEVQFLRPDPLRGNFYQTVWRSIERVTNGHGLPLLLLILVILAVPIVRAVQSNHKTARKP